MRKAFSILILFGLLLLGVLSFAPQFGLTLPQSYRPTTLIGGLLLLLGVLGAVFYLVDRHKRDD